LKRVLKGLPSPSPKYEAAPAHCQQARFIIVSDPTSNLSHADALSLAMRDTVQMVGNQDENEPSPVEGQPTHEQDFTRDRP
jgi:hypothetical protein